MARRFPTYFIAAAVWLAWASAGAQRPGVVQRAALTDLSPQRTRAIIRARRRHVAPRDVARMVDEAARLSVDSAEFRAAVAAIPLRGRFQLFKQLVEARPGREAAAAALQTAQQTVETRKAEVERVRTAATQEPSADHNVALRAAQDALRTANTELKTAETAYAAFEAKSFTRRVRGMLPMGNRRNNNETLRYVVEAGGMSGIGKGLIESGNVTVDGEIVRDPAAKIAAKAKVVVNATSGYQPWSDRMKQGTTLQSEKTFFEVTPGTLDLFAKVMGPNVAWFGGNRDPGHLHTVIADQGDRGKLHHNTYGTDFDEASITGNYTQYFMPKVLTDTEMDRFVRYQNAGYYEGLANKTRVYGFYARGQKIADMACTNWATSAPIGELPRWVRRVDKKVRSLPGVPAEVSDKGLYQALADAADGKAREALVQAVLAAPGHSKWSYKAVKDLARRVRRELDDRLAPWVHHVDGMLKKLAREGAISVPAEVAAKGLYRALEAAETREARQALVDAVMSEANMPQLHDKTRTAISNVAQHFSGNYVADKPLIKADFPARPTDLPLRQAMAKMLGLTRSKDPAMWLTGLMLHPDTSVVAVFKGGEPFKPEMDFGMELMGTVSPAGTMVKNAATMTSMIHHPNKGAVAVPAPRELPIEPAAAPAAGAGEQQGNE